MTGPSLAYMIESLPWAAAGFLAGSLTTLMFQSSPAATRELPMTTTGTAKRHRFTLVHAIGLVVVLLTIASAVQGWAQNRANERLTRCLIIYANATADAIEARAKANIDAQSAQVQMWRTVFPAVPDRGRSRGRAQDLRGLPQQAGRGPQDPAGPPLPGRATRRMP
jgi:hypothetical protein